MVQVNKYAIYQPWNSGYFFFFLIALAARYLEIIVARPEASNSLVQYIQREAVS
ncbi:MAG: hypothetical protein H7289_03955 [Mucilaginibacter sp.]|nr:hypothetical protein [Mucilaginibacter sp.]